MPACGYEFHLRVFNSISHEWVQRSEQFLMLISIVLLPNCFRFPF